MSSLYQIRQALPSGFEFYGTGSVDVDGAVSTGLLGEILAKTPRSQGVACRVIEAQGEFQATVMTLFGAKQDLNTYTEMANLFAAFVANNLSDQERGLFNGEYLVSPPQTLTQTQITRLLTSTQERLFRRYRHETAQGPVSLDLVVFPHSPWEMHHA